MFADRHKRDVWPDDLTQNEVYLIQEKAHSGIGYDWLPSKVKSLIQQGFAETNVLRRALGLDHRVLPDLSFLGTVPGEAGQSQIQGNTAEGDSKTVETQDAYALSIDRDPGRDLGRVSLWRRDPTLTPLPADRTWRSIETSDEIPLGSVLRGGV